MVIALLAASLPLQAVAGEWGPDDDEERYETVVTAGRGEESRFESPRAIRAFRRQDLSERLPGATPEALQDEPGLVMQRTNTGGGAPILRGLLGQHLLLLVDGIRLNTSITRHGPNQLLNTVDPFTVERVEVLRGPGSVLHGSDAIGGVINIITRKPLFDPRRAWDASAEATTRFDSADLGLLGNVGLAGHLRGVGLRVAGSLKRLDDLSGGRDTGNQPFTSYDEASADLSAAWAIKQDHWLRASYALVRQYDAPRTDKSAPADFRRFTEQFRDLAFLRYFGLLDSRHIKQVEATLSFHWQRELRERFRLDRDTIERERDGVSSLGGLLALRSDLPHNRLTYGLDLYHDWIASGAEEEGISVTGAIAKDRGRYVDGSRYLQMGAFLQDRVTFDGKLEKLALDVGLRVHASNAEIPAAPASGVGGGPGVPPAVSATQASMVGSLHGRYLMGDGLNIVAGVSQGYRAPNVDDYSALGCSGQGYDIPNDDLDAEKSITAEAGVKLDLAGILSGSLFYSFTYLHGFITRVPVKGAAPQICGLDAKTGDPVLAQVMRRENASSGMIHGIELDLRLDLGRRWSIFTWAAWTHGDVTPSLPGGASEPMSRVQPLNGLAGVRFAIQEIKGFAQLALRWAAPQDRLNASDLNDRRICPDGPAGCEGTPGYAVLTLRGAARLIDPLLITLAVENFTHETYRVHGSGVDGAGVSAVVGLELTIK